jgi:hypothetical protein
MKKLLIPIFVLMMIILWQPSSAQVIPTYPIPSYGVSVTGYANFRENRLSKTIPSKEKRSVNIIVSSQGLSNCSATVWVYSLDRATVLGPFTVTCGQKLTVPIDDREWGVLVESEEEVSVDVWIDP